MNIIETSIRPKDILDHLLLPHCSLIKQAVKIDIIGNSVVYCSQWFEFITVASNCFPNHDLRELKIGFNHVRIQGPMSSDEQLHVHKSMLLGLAVEGSGNLTYEKYDEELNEPVEAGDMFFVPRNSLHYLTGNPIFSFSALELGPEIDYQKHYYNKFED
ncbi:hypothetical protein QQ008_24560 [Fulvivirgaceae bacterium BMA10]|uniref:Cupin domain-containing protein n=1 Tax=Splendidivirga corallicola TaxID=3051826 RepID=A0ABT8KXA3_9BACT|nr:hypothetical protein [Fulvivirgaceae bacterium BMA10]